MAKHPRPPDTPSQPEKFRRLARELECDTDEAAFKAKLVKIAKAPRAERETKKYLQLHGTASSHLPSTGGRKKKGGSVSR